MNDRYFSYAVDLVRSLTANNEGEASPQHPERLLAARRDGSLASLNLTPFQAVPQAPNAADYFDGISDMEGLLAAYRRAKAGHYFEDKLPDSRVHAHAGRFLADLMEDARHFDDADARRIANWVRDFDVYVAVKAIESLLNSKADLALLELAEQAGWTVHFDHLAIRCGSAGHHAAQSVVEMLERHHDYVAPQMPEEVFYQFDDGWSAYLLYKILKNGQILRLFLDQSDVGYPQQIIQHWNHVYGYTAHHLAIRASREIDGKRLAVPLDTVVTELGNRGIAAMTPTGAYTFGLLLQVFARPEKNRTIPAALKAELAKQAPGLDQVIENGKLLELVSRRESDPAFARRFYALYGLEYEPLNPLHSVPIYQYFLPAQAAHVIRTSVQTD